MRGQASPPGQKRATKDPAHPAASITDTRTVGVDSAPGTLSVIAQTRQASAEREQCDREREIKRIAKGQREIRARADDHYRGRRRARPIRAAIARRASVPARAASTVPIRWASVTISSSVFTPLAPQQPLQRLIPAMGRHLDGRFAHAELSGHFAHGLVARISSARSRLAVAAAATPAPRARPRRRSRRPPFACARAALGQHVARDFSRRHATLARMTSISRLDAIA